MLMGPFQLRTSCYSRREVVLGHHMDPATAFAVVLCHRRAPWFQQVVVSPLKYVQKKASKVKNFLESLPQNGGKLRDALMTTCRFLQGKES